MLSSASFGSLVASVGLAVGLVGALLCILAKRAGSPKVGMMRYCQVGEKSFPGNYREEEGLVDRTDNTSDEEDSSFDLIN